MAFKRSAVRSRLSPPQKVLKTKVFGTFFFVFSPKKLGVLFCGECFDHNLTTIDFCAIGPIRFLKNYSSKLGWLRGVFNCRN